MGQRRLPAPRASWGRLPQPNRISPTPRQSGALRLVGDAVAQKPDPVDLDLDDISRLHPKRRRAPGPDAAGRAGHDHVARLQPRERRAVFDLARNIEDHLADGCVLNHLAVEAGLQPQWCEIACFVRCHHPGPESAGLRKILAGRELMRVPLKIAKAALVVTGVSCDVVPGILAGDVAAWLADDDGEFALEIEIFRDTRPDDVAKMPGLAVGEAAEHGGICDFGAAGFHAVRFIIEANAEDLVRIGYHWQPGDVCEAMSRGVAGRCRHLTQSAGGDGGFQIGISVAKMRAEIDGLCAIDETPARGAVDRKTRKLHRMSRGAGAASQSQWG